MEKSELKRRVHISDVFSRKRVLEGDIPAALNCIAVILAAFLMGRVVLFGMVSILSAAFVFGFITDDRRFYGAWAGAFIGLIFSGTAELWRYTAILVFAAAADVFYKDRAEVSSLKKAVLCSLSVIITGLVKYIAVTRLDFVIFITAVETLMAFGCVLAFCYGRRALASRDSLTGEKVMCLYFVLAAAAAGTGGFYIYGISVFIIISAFLVMYLSQTGGISSGAAMGTVLGLFALCSGVGTAAVFAAFSVMGLFGGTFRFMGKKGVAAAAVFSACVILFYMGGEAFNLKTVASLGLAAIAFLVFPPLITIENAAVTADMGYDFFKDLSAKRMEAVSQAIESISYAMENNGTEVSAKERIDRIIDSTVSRVCGDCGLSAYCWGSEIESTYRGFYKFTGECGKNGSVTEKDMPKEVSRNCVRLKSITDITNRNLDFYRQDMVWDSRIKEYKAADRRRMDIIGRVLSELSSSIRDDYKPDKRLTGKILSAVKDSVKTPVKVQAYTVNGISGVYAIGAGVDLSPLISRAAGRKYALTGSSSGGEEADIYTALPKFKATFAVAAKAKTGNAVTGDSYGDVCTEKGVAIILSDGMGTGEEARQESLKTVELAESFFKASLTGKTITELMDTVFLSDGDVFATADILETDLYDGRARFIKTGAAPSFIIRDGRIRTMRSSALPPGLGAEADTKVTEVNLKDGDIIIMMTDGVIGNLEAGKDESKWVKATVEALNSKDPRFIADSIIKEAERQRGIVSDDMTVAAVRIWEPLG